MALLQWGNMGWAWYWHRDQRSGGGTGQKIEKSKPLTCCLCLSRMGIGFQVITVGPCCWVKEGGVAEWGGGAVGGWSAKKKASVRGTYHGE